MAEHKYYTIAEISEMLTISHPNLRYLERTMSNLKVKKIRGRRYYSEKNLEILEKKLGKDAIREDEPSFQSIEAQAPEVTKTDYGNIVDQIVRLEQKFMNLQVKLES